jgi:hypothetical protein
LGIITNKGDEKKTKGVMVRLPSNVTTVIDSFVGRSHSSRPDFIVDAIRQYLMYVSIFEAEAILKVQDKDVSYTAKKAFYIEFMELHLDRMKKMYHSLQEQAKGRDVDVLLSMYPITIEMINGVVERTQFFKNHQEFIKLAIMNLIILMASYNTNELLISNFLQDPEDLKKLKKELDDLRAEANSDNKQV